MEGVVGRKLGTSLGHRWGFPHLSRTGTTYRVRRAGLALVAIGAFAAGTLATSAAATEHPIADVRADPTGQLVEYVSPTGFAWRDGARPGQRIVARTTADSPAGWTLETEDGTGRYRSMEAPIDQALRDDIGLALLGLAAGSLALLFLRTHRQWVLPAASIGLLASSLPLFVYGDPVSSTASMALAALVPSAWLSWRAPAQWVGRFTMGASAAALVGLWAVAWLSGSEAYSDLELGRRLLVVVGIGGLLIDRTVRPLLGGDVRRMARPQARDLLAVAGIVALVVLLVVVGNLPPTFVASALVLTVLLLPTARRFAGRNLARALAADVGQRAAADALEAERARISREIHDAPLQQLAGVIRRLEVKADSHREAAELQLVADQLRGVLVDLRPPVLDDLGLGAGLEFLAERTIRDGVPVRLALADASHIRLTDRPPPEVELAIFRIAQEAVANAVQHARASEIRVAGEIAAEGVDLEIRDDGVGFAAEKGRSATRRGHMGLASMRHRAQGIDAELVVEGSRHGTSVRVTWRR